METILLLSGPTAVGKSSLAKTLIEKYNFKKISTSSHLVNIANTNNIEPTKYNLKNIGDSLDLETKFSWVLNDVALPIINNSTSQHFWLIDAVRKAEQVNLFKSQFSDNCIHVHLSCPDHILESRYQSRLTSENESFSYAALQKHPNEISARNLESIADFIFDTSKHNSLSIAESIKNYL